jgi:hypothetical protein
MTDPLNGCDRTEAHIIPTGSAHEVGHHQWRQCSKDAGANAIEKLYGNEPSAIIRQCVEHAANRQDCKCREEDRLPPPGVCFRADEERQATLTSWAATMHADMRAVSSPLFASASF